MGEQEDAGAALSLAVAFPSMGETGEGPRYPMCLWWDSV